MRVLGVDPGLTRCGLGIVDGEASRQVKLVYVQVLRTEAQTDLSQRLLVVHRRVAELIAQHQPDVVAVERVFSQANTSTAMGTAQAGGVAILAAACADLPVATHTPSEIKAAVTGSGRADKNQVTTMVTRILRLSERPTPADAADALALAVCHLWRPSVLSAHGDGPSAPAAPTRAQQQWAQAAAQANRPSRSPG